MEFAKQYHANTLFWDEAFAFLKNTDLAAIKPGKYSIDGDNVSVTVYEGPSRLPDTTQWELHRKFEDIHYIFTGKEQIGIAPDSSATLIKDYDTSRDIAYYKAKGKFYSIPAGTFFIVFTHDVHQPGLKV
ncbi:MAG: YhcH/YjgK/YiaL family protein [Flavitalea sp.]